MRIALISHVVGYRDGQGRVNYEIARAALEAGMHVTIIAETCAEDVKEHDRGQFVCIPTSALPSRLLKNLSFALRSAHWLRRNLRDIDVIQANGFITFGRVDIVVAHFVHGAWLNSRYAFAARQGLSVSDLYQRAYARINAFLEQTAFRRAKRVVAVSTNVASELNSVGVSERLLVIFNGVDVQEFSPQKQGRSSFDLPDGVVLFLFAGDIKTRRKNLDGVLRAIAHVDGVHLAVAGPVDKSPYPSLARELGIAERVHFLGRIKEMNLLMGATDGLIFPSRYDPMGLVVLEAMASGLPVITACTTGASAVLDDPQWTLNDPDDAATLIKLVQRLADDSELRARLGARNRSIALAHSWTVMADSYLELFRKVSAETMLNRQREQAGFKETDCSGDVPIT